MCSFSMYLSMQSYVYFYVLCFNINFKKASIEESRVLRKNQEWPINDKTFTKDLNKIEPPLSTVLSTLMRHAMDNYESKQMSTVETNIDQMQKEVCAKVAIKYAVEFSACTVVLYLTIEFFR